MQGKVFLYGFIWAGGALFEGLLEYLGSTSSLAGLLVKRYRNFKRQTVHAYYVRTAATAKRKALQFLCRCNIFSGNCCRRNMRIISTPISPYNACILILIGCLCASLNNLSLLPKTFMLCALPFVRLFVAVDTLEVKPTMSKPSAYFHV